MSELTDREKSMLQRFLHGGHTAIDACNAQTFELYGIGFDELRAAEFKGLIVQSGKDLYMPTLSGLEYLVTIMKPFRRALRVAHILNIDEPAPSGHAENLNKVRRMLEAIGPASIGETNVVILNNGAWGVTFMPARHEASYPPSDVASDLREWQDEQALKPPFTRLSFARTPADDKAIYELRRATTELETSRKVHEELKKRVETGPFCENSVFQLGRSHRDIADLERKIGLLRERVIGGSKSGTEDQAKAGSDTMDGLKLCQLKAQRGLLDRKIEDLREKVLQRGNGE